MLLKTADGNPVDIDFVSGEETAHLTYVADAVEATVRALYVDSPSHFVYNVGGPVENYVSLRRFHEQIREIVPTAGEATFSGRARSAGPVDISRMVDDLGYQPRFLTIDALRDLFGDKSD